MKKTALLLFLALPGCQALSDFGEGLKTGVCDFIEPIKDGVRGVTSLLGPMGAVIAAPINLGLETMCKGTGFGITVVTNPVMIPESAVETTEGIVRAFSRPFEAADGDSGDSPQ